MKVLAICAHPDDAELSCGGTLIKCVKRGDDVTVCHVSDGDLGHMVIGRKELGEIRCREAQNAAKKGGYKCVYAGFHDLDIYPDNKEARDRIVEIIRSVKPDFIITHNPEDYMADHVAVSKLAFDASFAASVPHYECAVMDASEVVPIFYMSTSAGVGFVPTEYVDISDEIEQKKEAFMCHESQIVWLKDHTGIDYVERVDVVAKFWGYQCSAKAAEGFRQCLASQKITTKRMLP